MEEPPGNQWLAAFPMARFAMLAILQVVPFCAAPVSIPAIRYLSPFATIFRAQSTGWPVREPAHGGTRSSGRSLRVDPRDFIPRGVGHSAILFDVDSRIPNLALMKLSAFHRERGAAVTLVRVRSGGVGPRLDADHYFASSIFNTDVSAKRVHALRALYGERIEIGGTGVDLLRRLPPEVEVCFPDYGLYAATHYAVGFLTRGCNKRCPFCVVPAKEGRLKRRSSGFDDFVPSGQRNVLLLDDNLLSFEGVAALLQEMIDRDYAINFSQTLDIAYLDEAKYELLRRVDSRNARFNKRMIYFSLNYVATTRQFEARRDMLRGLGENHVAVVCLYGFDTTLRQDYERFLCLRRLRLIPFFQEYWPIAGVPARVPADFFDMDLNAMIRLTFLSNGQNWEKYLRWLNRLYFARFGRYYRPLIDIIYRYNNKERIARYLRRPEWLTAELYRDFRPAVDPKLPNDPLGRELMAEGLAMQDRFAAEPS